MNNLTGLNPAGMTSQAPGPGRIEMLADIPELRRDMLAYCAQAIERYGDIVQLRIGPVRAFIVNDPDAAHRVLVDRNKDYVRTYSARAVSRILGKGLITSSGDLWRRQRRIIQPIFHSQVINGLVDSIASAVDSMLNTWSLREPSRAFDMHEEMMRLTLLVIGRTLFSIEIDDRNSDIGKAFSDANAHADYYAKKFFLFPAWVPTPRNVAIRQTLRKLGALVSRIVDEHRATNRSDLLSMLLAARDEDTGAPMSDRQLHDEILTLVAAGHETTANLLSWCFHLLSSNPAIEQRVHAEVSNVLGLRRPTLADLANLPFTTCVLQETMRLYPPVWMIDREAMVDDELNGYRVPVGSHVLVFTYGLHRHHAHWDQPSLFDPERFLPERSEGRHRGSYLPFSIGPRRCVGSSLALMEAQIALAMIVQRYSVTVVPNHPVEMAAMVTLRPKHGIQVTAGPRQCLQPTLS
jgi:cytochrome P450